MVLTTSSTTVTPFLENYPGPCLSQKRSIIGIVKLSSQRYIHKTSNTASFFFFLYNFSFATLSVFSTKATFGQHQACNNDTLGCWFSTEAQHNLTWRVRLCSLRHVSACRTHSPVENDKNSLMMQILL